MSCPCLIHILALPISNTEKLEWKVLNKQSLDYPWQLFGLGSQLWHFLGGEGAGRGLQPTHLLKRKVIKAFLKLNSSKNWFSAIPHPWSIVVCQNLSEKRQNGRGSSSCQYSVISEFFSECKENTRLLFVIHFYRINQSNYDYVKL